jgi:hypothetical protein
MKALLLIVSLIVIGCHATPQTTATPTAVSKPAAADSLGLPNERYFCIAPRLKALQERDGPYNVKADPEFAATHGANELWFIYNNNLGTHGCGAFGATLADATESAIVKCSSEALANEPQYGLHKEPPPDASLVKRFKDKLEAELAMCLKKDDKK